MRGHGKHFLARMAAFLILVTAAVVVAPRGWAQTENATLQGTVTDPSGAVIPQAQVTITNMATKFARAVTTNGIGEFVAVGLNPGTYSVRVEHAGFKTAEVRSIVLSVGAREEIPIRLAVGTATETVTVNGSAIPLLTTSSAVSNVVNQQEVANMPLNGRSFQNLMLLSPGTTTNSPQSAATLNTGQISVNGQGTASNSFTVDGVSANVGAGNKGGYTSISSAGALPMSTALGTTQSLVSVEDLQEFRVETSSYNAEYGGTPGGQFVFTTKSGGNSFHGEAFDYLRNNYFDANDWFNNYYDIAQQPLRQNDFGGTLGGPVVLPHIYNGHDKTFFFVSYEGLRLMQPIAAYQSYVPDLTVRAAATGVMADILNAFPTPTGPDVPYEDCSIAEYGAVCEDGLATFVSGYSAPSRIDSTSVRIDHNFLGSENIFFRVSDTPTSSETEYEAGQETYGENAITYTLGLTSVLPHHITNEFRANFTTSTGSQVGTYVQQNGATATDLLQDFGYSDSLPSYAIVLEYEPGVGTSSISAFKGVNSTRQFNLTDATSLVRGTHNIKLGIDLRRLTSTNLPESPLVGYDFYYPSTLDANSVDYGYTYAFAASFPVFYNFAAYAQDEWRVTPRLTLNYGLRWDLNPAAGSRRGPLPYQLLNQNDLAALMLAPAGTPIYQTTYYNFAPRLGASYLAHSASGHETIVRGGGGIFYDTGTDQADTLSDYVGPGFEAGNSYCDESYCTSEGSYSLPLPVADRYPAAQYPPVAPYTYTAYAYSPHLALPYSFEYNAAMQQNVGSSNAFTISYVGSAGRKTIGGQEVYAYYINPSFQNVFLLSNRLNFSYNSLQIVFQHRITHGLYAYAGYTWAHGIMPAQINSYSAYVPANASTDVRNNFNAVATYDIPGSPGNAFARAILAHWGTDVRISARTGFPLLLYGSPEDGGTVTGGTNIDPGVNYAPGYNANNVWEYGSEYPGGRALNPAAFTDAAIGAAGNVPQNYYRGFGAYQWNLAVRRYCPLRDTLGINFRAAAFNLFNRPNFGEIDPVISDPTFGQAINSLASGLGGLSPQYQAGGPRSMQFALKLNF